MTKRRNANTNFWSLFFGRLFLVALLTFATYNPWGWSYYHWVTNGFGGFSSPSGALQLLCGIMLIIGYTILFRATWRAKGPGGIFLTMLFYAGIIYFVWTLGGVDLGNPDVVTYIAQILLIVILTVGSLWSIFWKYLTGQLTVDDGNDV